MTFVCKQERMVNIMIQWVMTGLVAMLHPFYISVVEINHNPKEANVEISVRIFTEDLEKTLKKYTPGKIDLGSPADKVFIDKQVSNYIAQKLKLKLNGQPVTLHYIGYEIQKESAWCYFEVPGISTLSKLEVDCSLLYDFEKGQTNMFHVKSKGTEKNYKLDYPKTSTVFEF